MWTWITVHSFIHSKMHSWRLQLCFSLLPFFHPYPLCFHFHLLSSPNLSPPPLPPLLYPVHFSCLCIIVMHNVWITPTVTQVLTRWRKWIARYRESRPWECRIFNYSFATSNTSTSLNFNSSSSLDYLTLHTFLIPPILVSTVQSVGKLYTKVG